MSIKNIQKYFFYLFFIPLITMAKSPLHALDLPKTQVLLTIAGNIQTFNKGNHALYDLKMIQNLPAKTLHHQLLWDENKPRDYKGFSLLELLSALEGQGDKVVFLNTEGETFEISWDDLKSLEPWVVYESQGESLVKKHGALILVFSFSFAPDDPKHHLFDEKPWKVYKITIENFQE
jgi:hypothetical protein